MTSALLGGAVYVVGWLLLVGRRPDGRAPRLTAWGVALVVIVAAGWVAQLLRPALLGQGMRDPAATSATRATPHAVTRGGRPAGRRPTSRIQPTA